MRVLARASTTDDYRELARRRLPAFLFHYVDGAAGREFTASRNCTAMDEIALEQRVMIDVHSVSTKVELFGTRLSMPVILGPVGLAGLLARRGEVQAHRAASMAGTAFCLSTLGICALDEVAGAKAPPPWFQLYMIRDRVFMKDLLQSIEHAHVPALVLTVDVPVSGIRPRERRFGLTSGMATHISQAMGKPGWTWDVALNGGPLIFGSVARAAPQARRLGDFWGWLGANFDPTVTWQDISFVREHWSGPIIIKGIMNPSDARAALGAGADGIVVSNHGGRQLDGTLATIACLPGVVDAIGDQVPVLVDGGIRSGTDVVKALASGARACLLGRAWAFALAAGGERALSRYLDNLRSEIKNTLALTGCADIRDAGPALLASRASG